MLSKRPICLVIDESVKFTGISCWYLVVVASISLTDPLYLYTGEFFCHLVTYTSAVGIIQCFSGSFGIALMRLLFVIFPNQIHLGQNTTATLIGVATTILSIAASILYVASPKRTMDYTSMCLGRSLEFHTTLFDYLSDQSLAYELRLIAFGLLSLGMVLVLSELVMYSWIFKFLVQHDRQIRLVLSDDVFRSRTRKNVIDLAGHSLSCFVELVWLALGASGYYWVPIDIKVFLRCQVMSIYGMLSALHIALSPPLRADCVVIWNKLFSSPFQNLRSMIITNCILRRSVQPVTAPEISPPLTRDAEDN